MTTFSLKLMFLSSVRGTFARHRFQAAERPAQLNPPLASNLDEVSPPGGSHESRQNHRDNVCD
jgi:hypothetical protein